MRLYTCMNVAILYTLTFQWSVAPLVDNVDSHLGTYKVSVYTGMRQSAGTRSRVCFILTGDYGDTGVRVMDDGRAKVRTT